MRNRVRHVFAKALVSSTERTWALPLRISFRRKGLLGLLVSLWVISCGFLLTDIVVHCR